MLLYTSIDHFRPIFNIHSRCLYTIAVTITNRNRIIILSIALIFTLFVIAIISVILILRANVGVQLQGDYGINQVLFAVSHLAQLIYCLGTTLMLYVTFRKTTSPEIFFFTIFVVAMSLDSFKSLQVVVDISDMSPFFGMIITRVVYYGKFLGTLSLFSAGLFSTGVEYQRTEIVLGIALLLAFVLAATVPVDVTELKENLVHELGRHLELVIISVLFQVFAFLSFVLAGIQSNNKSYFAVAAGAGAVMTGRHLLFYRNDMISVVVSFVFLVAGSILFSERTRKIHLWL